MIFALTGHGTTLRGVGIPVWVWFLIAVLAVAAGVALLIVDRVRRTPNNRERRRWAALRGWQFAEVDQVLPTRWEHGVLAQHSSPIARDVVAGSTFTGDGRRQVYVLDVEVSGKPVAVLTGIRSRRETPVVAEFWLPEVPVPQDSELDLLGPVGPRYAFVTDVAAARKLVSPDLVEAVEEAGSDASVVWLEGDWVLAAVDPADADPGRLERLLRALGDLADVVDPTDTAPKRGARDEPSNRDESSEPDDAGGGAERERAAEQQADA